MSPVKFFEDKKQEEEAAKEQATQKSRNTNLLPKPAVRLNLAKPENLDSMKNVYSSIEDLIKDQQQKEAR